LGNAKEGFHQLLAHICLNPPHHAEIIEDQGTSFWTDSNIPRMGIGMEKAIIEQLLKVSFCPKISN
jgi:hypothetical protein